MRLAYSFLLLSLFSCEAQSINGDLQEDRDIKSTKKTIANNSDDNIIIMELWVWGGNQNYDLIIGADSGRVDREYNSISTYKDSISKMFEVHKHVLSKPAIKYIEEFIKINCVSGEKKVPVGEHFFYIVSSVMAPTADRTICCIENKKLGITYFSALIKWLEESPYKKECRYLIGDMRAKFIAGEAFPFTPFQQNLLDSVERRNK